MSNEIIDLKLNGQNGEIVKGPNGDEQESALQDVALRYDALKDSDVNGLSSKTRPTLVTLFGISECGKTTFVGSLFAILRRRPNLLNVEFFDSDTLTGFERRVHQRLLSKSGKSVIQRTQRKMGSILNVEVGNDKGEDKHMIVISDLSGEIYKDAISNKDLVLEQTAVKYADRLVIFVDLEALLSTKQYVLYKSNFKSLLTRFKENQMLPEGAEYYIAFNKIDLVKGDWAEKKKAILDIVKDVANVPEENIYEISSLGIKEDGEDAGLLALFRQLLSKKEEKTLPEGFNWIQSISKGE